MTTPDGDLAAPPASPLVTSFVRTLTPLFVGAILTLLARWKIPGADAETLNGLLDPILTAGYYAVARILEHYVDRRFGWLLGAAKTPVYQDPQVIEGTVVGSTTTPAGYPAPSLMDLPPMTVQDTTPPTVVVNVYNGLPSGGTITETEPPAPKRTPRRSRT